MTNVLNAALVENTVLFPTPEDLQSECYWVCLEPLSKCTLKFNWKGDQWSTFKNLWSTFKRLWKITEKRGFILVDIESFYRDS